MRDRMLQGSWESVDNVGPETRRYMQRFAGLRASGYSGGMSEQAEIVQIGTQFAGGSANFNRIVDLIVGAVDVPKDVAELGLWTIWRNERRGLFDPLSLACLN